MDAETNNPKTAALVANGTISDFEKIGSRVRSFPYVVAVDGGICNCQQMGVTPNIIIGDLDSAPPELLQHYSDVPQKLFPADKDKTDLELAIEEAASQGMERIVIFGALERRMDHSVYNLHLLRRHPGLLSIESEYETLFVIDHTMEVPCQQGQTISLIPLGGPVQGVTTKGLKWELNNATFNRDFMSISNICLSNSFLVEVQSGDILCCLCK